MHNVITIHHYKFAYGEKMLGSYENKLCICDWKYRRTRQAIDKRIQKELNATYQMGDSDVIQLAKQQLDEYFLGERKEFTINLLLAGSEFQKKVWNELQKIPYGETETYLGLAGKLNNEKAIRAVASANGANALSIFIPCHRVIGSNGELTGYAGGLPVKKKLLQLEGALAKPIEQDKLF